MEATLEVISNLCDIRHVDILAVLVVIFGEFKIHLLGEEEFEEEIHQFGVLLLLEVLISEHHHTSAHN